jgi:beta-N-acetylhexosaminidase
MWIETQLDRLTPAQRLAQLVLVLPGVDAGRPDAATRHALELGVGALHSVTAMSAAAAARYHNEVADICAAAALPPALISANLESGLAYALGASGTDFPYPRGVGLSGSAELAYAVARASAEEARAVGYHWTFSPCVDVVRTPDDPILGVRAYGVPPAQTAELATAQIRGYQDGGLLATAKHFPGHGDSSVDSHRDLPRLDRGRAEHESVHLPPFRASIAAGVASIMVAHLTLPLLGVDDPASLSATVNRQWLRADLGFDGLVVTDALRMAAISRRLEPAQAALAALRAGADVANVKCAADEAPRIVDHLVAALADGLLDEDEINASVRRLLAARVRLGLHESTHVDVERAAQLDHREVWRDPRRASTVSHHGTAPVPGRPVVVVGDSALARRLAAIGPGFVLEPEPLTAGSLVRAADRHPGAMLLPVFSPGTVSVAAQRKAVAGITGRPDAIVVNSSATADAFADLAGYVITVPAVDAFDIRTDAAVYGALDVLRSSTGKGQP